MAEILVIDDEAGIRQALYVGLHRNGYKVRLAGSGVEGLELAATRPPDVVVLDLVMPGLDGLEVCRALREWTQLPILVLSVDDSDGSKVRALDLGADDYLTKPFSMGELLARLRAIMRRMADDPGSPYIDAGDLRIDFARRQVTLRGQPVRLTPTEYQILRFMALNPDRVLTHRQLVAAVWGEHSSENAHTLRVHIANLRSKIEPDAVRPRLLHTELRLGYRFRIL